MPRVLFIIGALILDSWFMGVARSDEAVGREWGRLRGKVTWRGPLPDVKSFEEEIRRHPDANLYLKSPKESRLDPTWRIDPRTRGVANVVVFLQQSSNERLPIHDDDKKRDETIVLDAPHCNYVPHVVALYPQWRIGKAADAHGKTGQRFFVTCTRKDGPGFFFKVVGDTPINPGDFVMMRPGQKTELYPRAQPTPLVVDEPIRPWMKAYVWAFDHPYFAVTKDDGSFEMPRVPLGVELKIVAWHEANGWVYGRAGKTMTLRDQENRVDFEMKAKNTP
jgi:hypothetical protein